MGDTKLVPCNSEKLARGTIIVRRETNQKYIVRLVGLHPIPSQKLKTQFEVPDNAAILGKLIVIESTKDDDYTQHYTTLLNAKRIQFNTEFQKYKETLFKDNAIFDPNEFDVSPSR